MDSETNKGKSCFVHNDNKFREYYRKKNGHVCYRCTVKTCKAGIEMREDVVVAERHIHAACLRSPFQQGSVDVRVPFWSYNGSLCTAPTFLYRLYARRA